MMLSLTVTIDSTVVFFVPEEILFYCMECTSVPFYSVFGLDFAKLISVGIDFATLILPKSKFCGVVI